MPFCSLCRDFLANRGLRCTKCGQMVCQVMALGESGCAYLHRVINGREAPDFVCIVCARDAKESIKVGR